MLTRTKIIKMMLLIPFLRPARLSSLYLASVEDVFSVVQGAKKQLHQPNIKIMKTTNQHQYKHPNQFRSQQQQQQQQEQKEQENNKQEARSNKRQTTNNEPIQPFPPPPPPPRSKKNKKNNKNNKNYHNYHNYHNSNKKTYTFIHVSMRSKKQKKNQ